VRLLLVIFAGAAALHAAPVTALRFSPDGDHLLISRPRAIEVRAADGKAQPRRIPCQFDKVLALAFDPAGKTLAVTGGTPGDVGGVHLLDWPTGKLRGKWNVFDDVATCVAFNVKGQLVAGSASGLLVQLDLRREERVAHWFDSHTKAARAVAFLPDGKQFVSVGADATVKLWAMDTKRPMRTLAYHGGAVHALAMRPFLGRIPLSELVVCATSSDDRTVRVWQPVRGRMVRIVRGHAGPVHAVEFSEDGRRMISIGREGVGRVIDAESDRVLHQWTAHRDWVYALAIGPKNQIATGDWRGEVKMWQLKGDKVLKAD